MAAGVFGVPISEETLTATGEYEGRSITQNDIADYAMKMINAGGKDINAQHFVDNLKERYGDGITTKCLIYNATGTTMNLATYHDWHGNIYSTPYPSVIQNGQWGAFIHIHSFLTGSAGAVVYRTKRPGTSSASCDWMFSWSIPLVSLGGSNRVYTEIREEGHFPAHWEYIYHTKLENSARNFSDDNYGYVSRAEIGEDTTANARAIFQLPK